MMFLASEEVWRKGKEEKKHPYSFWENQIKTNVDYESLMMNYPYEHKLIDEIIAIMVETVMSNRDMIRIASDDYPFSVVKEKIYSPSLTLSRLVIFG